jgi:hypothetical protein
MAEEALNPIDPTNAPSFAFGQRPTGYAQASATRYDGVPYAFAHRPQLEYATDPPPTPSVVEHFIMNAQRTSGAFVTWVVTGAPDTTGTYAPAGAALVAASIVLVKRGLFY